MDQRGSDEDIIPLFLHGEIARQEQAHIRVGGDGAVSQHWVARAKDYIAAKLNADFFA